MWNSSLPAPYSDGTAFWECTDLLHHMNREETSTQKLEYTCKRGVWPDRKVCYALLEDLGKQPWGNSSIEMVCGLYGEEILHAVLHSSSPPVAERSFSQILVEDTKRVIIAAIFVSILALVAGAACICICMGSKSRVGQLAVAPGTSCQGLGAMYRAVPTEAAPERAQGDLAHQGNTSADCPNCADIDPAAKAGSVPLLVSDDLKCRDGSVCLAGLPEELAAKLAAEEEDVQAQARTSVTLESGDSPCHGKPLVQPITSSFAEGKLVRDRSDSRSRYEDPL